MADLKLIEPLSDWIELRLDTHLLPPPGVLRIRVRPGHGLDAMDAFANGDRKLSSLTLSGALAVIAEWDLTQDGKPWPCTEDIKSRYAVQLKTLLASRIKEDEAPAVDEKAPVKLAKFAASVILEASLAEETFLKN